MPFALLQPIADLPDQVVPRLARLQFTDHRLGDSEVCHDHPALRQVRVILVDLCLDVLDEALQVDRGQKRIVFLEVSDTAVVGAGALVQRAQPLHHRKQVQDALTCKSVTHLRRRLSIDLL